MQLQAFKSDVYNLVQFFIAFQRRNSAALTINDFFGMLNFAQPEQESPYKVNVVTYLFGSLP